MRNNQTAATIVIPNFYTNHFQLYVHEGMHADLSEVEAALCDSGLSARPGIHVGTFVVEASHSFHISWTIAILSYAKG